MKKLMVMATVGLLIMASTVFAKEAESEKAEKCIYTRSDSRETSKLITNEKLKKSGIRTSKPAPANVGTK